LITFNGVSKKIRKLKMKILLALAMGLLFLLGCKSTEKLDPISQIKPSVANEGTLANARLIADAKVGLEQTLGNAIEDTDLLKFVIQQPVGKAGSRSWREMWIVKTSENESQFIMTFKEEGLGAADFEITPMQEEMSGNKCPNNIAKFPIGETTSDDVLSCMGKPQHEDYNPDGRFVYLYETPQKIIFTYLFGTDKKLLKITGYENTGG
jgi:outer membrane protein assembly factor BamE (lipoprotein component of BamABCDE complex)